jgi:hypothetical protein
MKRRAAWIAATVIPLAAAVYFLVPADPSTLSEFSPAHQTVIRDHLEGLAAQAGEVQELHRTLQSSPPDADQYSKACISLGSLANRLTDRVVAVAVLNFDNLERENTFLRKTELHYRVVADTAEKEFSACLNATLSVNKKPTAATTVTSPRSPQPDQMESPTTGTTTDNTESSSRNVVTAPAVAESAERTPVRETNVGGRESKSDEKVSDTSAPTDPPPPPLEDPETRRREEVAQAWSAVMRSTSEAVLEAYAERAEGTIYATLARAKLKELRDAEAEKAREQRGEQERQRQVEQDRQRQAEQERERNHSPEPEPQFAGVPVVDESSSCHDLWRARNAIYYQHRYCFTTSAGRSAFGNEGCFRDQNSAWNAMDSQTKRRVTHIKKLERRKC